MKYRKDGRTYRLAKIGWASLCGNCAFSIVLENCPLYSDGHLKCNRTIFREYRDSGYNWQEYEPVFSKILNRKLF